MSLRKSGIILNSRVSKAFYHLGIPDFLAHRLQRSCVFTSHCQTRCPTSWKPYSTRYNFSLMSYLHSREMSAGFEWNLELPDLNNIFQHIPCPLSFRFVNRKFLTLFSGLRISRSPSSDHLNSSAIPKLSHFSTPPSPC